MFEIEMYVQFINNSQLQIQTKHLLIITMCVYAHILLYICTCTYRKSFFCRRCMLRVLDSFGTEPEFNHAHYAQSKGHKTPWGKWNLNPQQFYTMFRKYPWLCEEFAA